MGIEEELKKSSFFYEQFITEFNDEERDFFIKLLKHCVYVKGYPKCDELYYFCYFSTMKRRLEKIGRYKYEKEGLSSYLFAFGIRDVNEMVKYYKGRLERLKVEEMRNRLTRITSSSKELKNKEGG